MRSQRAAWTLFFTLVALSVLAAACGADGTPQTSAETVEVKREGQGITETVAVDKVEGVMKLPVIPVSVRTARSKVVTGQAVVSLLVTLTV